MTFFNFILNVVNSLNDSDIIGLKKTDVKPDNLGADF